MVLKLGRNERFVTFILGYLPFLMSLFDLLKKLSFFAPHDRDYYALNTFFLKHQKINILDIGANIGQSAVGFHKIFPNASIHVIEANPELGKSLEKLRKKGVVQRVTIAFVGSSEGGAKVLYIPKLNGHSFSTFASLDLPTLKFNLQNFFSDRIFSQFIFQKYESDLINIDSLEIESVDLMKIDVEGFENSVLEGARGLIKKCEPVIFLEINSKSLFKTIQEFASTVDYRLFSVDMEKSTELSLLDFDNQKSRNFLLLKSNA